MRMTTPSRPHIKLGALLLAVGMILGFASCGGTGNPTPTHQPPSKPSTGTVPKGPGGV